MYQQLDLGPGSSAIAPSTDTKRGVASLVVAAESLATRKVFNRDRRDFATYQIRRGHRHQAIEIVS
ncbi:MAG: hypothetical protein ACKOEC_05585 [Acidimicrobiia bacterium]